LTGNKNVDVWGHVGGLIFGFFAFVYLVKPFGNQTDGACCEYKIWNYVAISTSSIFAILAFTLYYSLGTYEFDENVCIIK